MHRRESRRRPRLETRQPASALALGEALACEIRNFCRMGLYLAFADSAEGAPPAPRWAVGVMVEVLFTAEVDGRPQMFRLLGSVARATAAGAGLMVPSMPPQALVALQAAAVAANVTSSAPPAAAETASDPLSRCRQLLASTLGEVLEGFFTGLDAACQAAAQKTAAAVDRQRLREVPAVLRADREGIGQRLVASAQAGLVARAPGKSAPEAADGEQSLSLLDEAEFEDWLNVAAVINRLETDGGFAAVLAKTETPLAELTGRPVDRQTNPFGAAAIGRVFQEAIRELPLAGTARAVAYQAFGAAMEAPWRELAPRLVEALKRAETAEDAPAGQAAGDDGAPASEEPAEPAPGHTDGEADAAANAEPALRPVYSLDGALAGVAQTGAYADADAHGGPAAAGDSAGPSLWAMAQGMAPAAGHPAPSSTPQNISSKVIGTRSSSSASTGLLLSQERPRSKLATFCA